MRSLCVFSKGVVVDVCNTWWIGLNITLDGSPPNCSPFLVYPCPCAHWNVILDHSKVPCSSNKSVRWGTSPVPRILSSMRRQRCRRDAISYTAALMRVCNSLDRSGGHDRLAEMVCTRFFSEKLATDFLIITLPENNTSHLKMDGMRSFPFGFWPIFRGKLAVGFREGTWIIYIYIYRYCKMMVSRFRQT